ncbi:MAG: hypothetical protein KAG84_07570 [Bacteroidales bacterium]|nr:hypothetical protein [Bacteroidales bacterium]
MKIFFRYIIFIIVAVLVLFSCSTSNTDDEIEANDNSAISIWSDTVVKAKYEDGSIQLVWGFKPNDEEMHYEWQYYRNGNLWLEGPMYDTLRHGIWKGYNEQGALIAQGIFKIGKTSGIYTVWYDNGVKFYEGNMNDGKRVGDWLFYNKEAELVKTIDYSRKDSIK